MKEAMEQIINSFQNFSGVGYYVYLFVAVLVYFALNKKEKEGKKYFLYPSLILIIVIFNPVTGKILGDHFIGWDVYWRMFWTLPILPAIAFCAVRFVNGTKGKGKKAVVLLLLMGTMAGTGNLIYRSDLFAKSPNKYKLPHEAILVAEVIKENQKNEGVKKATVVLPYELVCYLRQYDATINLKYGRNAHWGNLGRRSKRIYNEMTSTQPDYQIIVSESRKSKVNYIVIAKAWKSTDALAQLQFEEVGSTNTYVIYKDSTDQENE